MNRSRTTTWSLTAAAILLVLGVPSAIAKPKIASGSNCSVASILFHDGSVAEERARPLNSLKTWHDMTRRRCGLRPNLQLRRRRGGTSGQG
jgi:hypothetical protein